MGKEMPGDFSPAVAGTINREGAVPDATYARTRARLHAHAHTHTYTHTPHIHTYTRARHPGGWAGFLKIKLVAATAATCYSLWAMADIAVFRQSTVTYFT